MFCILNGSYLFIFVLFTEFVYGKNSLVSNQYIIVLLAITI